MKIEDLENRLVLTRPEENKREVTDGVYKGVISSASLQERDCKFSPDGTRIVLNIHVQVEDQDGNMVDLYISPNYSWNGKGNMMKILDELEMVPEKNSNIDLSDFIDIPVKVTVENTEKNGTIYSNIVKFTRVDHLVNESQNVKKRVVKKTLKQDIENNIFD